ncbi:hypothetical protein ANCDUO_03258, partial [Ancylostoma duodenale]
MWKAFDEVTEGVKGPTGGKLNMIDFGQQWSKQMGFPLVTIKSFNSSAVKISQERYMLNPRASTLQKYRSPSYGSEVGYFTTKDKIVLRSCIADQPLYLDVDQTVPIAINVDRRGYFRQNYDSAGWQKIIAQFENNHE